MENTEKCENVLETKEELIQTIKKWVKVDNEIRTLQSETNKRKQEKKNISGDLINVMKKHEIDCFDITDGQINYVKHTVKKPITQKMLLNILSSYFSDDTFKAKEVNDFILNQREEVIKEKISRTFKK